MSLLQFAAGWLGWTQEQTLATDVNYINEAYDGRIAMFQALFGSSDDSPKKKKPRVSGEQIKLYAKTHNALLKHGRLKKRAGK